MKFGIGQPMRRHEDLRLVTGRGRYTDDITLPGMAHAFVLRAPVAHAHIKRIDATAARRMPGVLFVATGEDVRANGLGDVPCMVPLVNRDGTPRRDTPRPVLALGKVRHVGQPVALVVAETFNAARDAAEAIVIEYDQLPAVTGAKDAIAAGVAQLFDHIPGNIVFDWDNDMGDAKATEAAFAKASRVVTLELINNRLVVNSMEPRNAIADYDREGGRSTLYTATQGVHFVRDPLAEAVLKIPKDRLRVITPNVGGAFGMKAFVYPEHALVVWASRKLERPVKWQEDRSEGFVSDNQGRDHRTRAELALDETGRFRLAGFDPCESWRLSVAVWLLRADTFDRSRLRSLFDWGDSRERQRRLYQHRAGLRLSRRGTTRGRIPARAPRRRRGTRTRHQPGRNPPRQFRAAVGDALHIGDHALARFR